MDLKQILNWLIGKNLRLTLENKFLLYRTIIKPIWMYPIESGDMLASQTLQKLKNPIQTMTNAP